MFGIWIFWEPRHSRPGVFAIVTFIITDIHRGLIGGGVFQYHSRVSSFFMRHGQGFCSLFLYFHKVDFLSRWRPVSWADGMVFGVWFVLLPSWLIVMVFIS
ncbi:hypothetical protein QBC40DRAFT_102895 [Triangularia verruculosa]|uniref:Uncharacterized protein n=1 Tax=Triangularia verruculosa TaxID=2587418 RepID=A0AAN6XC98_9PEZI|nr:hypothetical protein QBC40DRAFT_102895 [Triangularia verruculosa]